MGVASSVGLVVGMFSSWMEAVFNNAAGGLTQLMIWCARATVAIPGGTMKVPNPPLWLVGCWYAGVLLLTWWLWRLTRATPPARPGSNRRAKAARTEGGEARNPQRR